MTTPSTWHEHARHYLHREQRRPCGQCPDGTRHDPACTYPYDKVCDCELRRPEPATDPLPRQHDPDCILFCTRQLDGDKCRILHGCWCAFTPEDVTAW